MHGPDRGARGLRLMGIGAAAITLAAVAANVVWFARRGLGPLTLLAAAGPLWLAVAAVLSGAGAVAYLLARALSRPGPPGRTRHDPQRGR